MRGGKRDGSGRKRGIPNKLNAALREKLNAGGIAPLEFMLQVMRDTHQDFAVRLEMAKAAAPYLHPRLQAVEYKDEKNATTQRWHVEFVSVAKRVDTAPANENLPPNGIAQLNYGPRHPSAGAVISREEEGEIVSSTQPVTYVTGRAW